MHKNKKFYLIKIIGFLVNIVIISFRFINIYFFKYPSAFGHQAMNTEYYSRKLKKKHKLYKLIGVPQSEYIPNKALYKHHVESGIVILKNSLIVKLLLAGIAYQKDINKKGKRLKSFLNATICGLVMDPEVMINSRIAMPFNHQENLEAENILNNIELEKDYFVLFQGRNDNYYSIKQKETGADYSKWSGHQLRLGAVSDLYLASENLHKNGIKSVLAGAYNEKISSDSMIIDYPSNYREDFGDFADLALMENCKFFVGSNTGLMMLAYSFNKPVLMCNVFPWPWCHVPMRDSSVVMPKKLWSIENKRFLTIGEMIQMEEKFYYKKITKDKSFFKSLSIEVVDNTDEEIALAAMEVNSRIDKTWDKENYPLSSMLKNHIGGVSKSYFSTSFIELNREILNY